MVSVIDVNISLCCLMCLDSVLVYRIDIVSILVDSDSESEFDVVLMLNLWVNVGSSGCM